MLTAGGRAPPFGDLGDGATAAGADVGIGVQLANLFAGGWWALGVDTLRNKAARPTRSAQANRA